jgi:hypothetical protein
MAKGRHGTRDGKSDKRLVCRVQQLSYDFRTWTGRLDFPAGNCCDMSGAISIFTAIDPDVRVIETFAGGNADTIYRLSGEGRGEWEALMR